LTIKEKVFKKNSMKSLALITGATSGIGKATSLKFAENDINLILTGRRMDRLEKLKNEIDSQFSVQVQILCFDIMKKNETDKAFARIENPREIDILINNAGLAAGLDPFHKADLTDWERMIDTNIKGLLYISRLLTPYMVEMNRGHIINVGSIAGKQVYANGNVYCASKFAVDALTQAMRTDLLPYGIKVGQVAPGAVETEFSLVRFHGDNQKAKNVYTGFEPLLANDIADAIFYMISRPPHVNINDMLIMPTAQASAFAIHRK
jgi:3-hydroxy acid dehydrogenase / malonic semialdehyde reductase